MKSVPFRAVLLILLAIVAIGSVTTTSNISKSTGTQAIDGPCSEKGITLVIEYGPLEQGSIIRCVQDFEGTSWNLFQAADLTVQGTASYPTSFVCRIQGQPSAEIEPCDGTPSVQTGSWIYFVANADEEPREWQRSPVGASSRTPKCGDSEAWVFSKDSSVSPLTKPSIIQCR
jgi:hypothetical protein